MPRSSAVVIALTLAVITSAAHAATYHGHSVDGPRFDARLENDDLGTFDRVEVRFSGTSATVFLRGGSQITLELDEEEIVDPRHVKGRDYKRGVTWELSIRNLRESEHPAR